MPWSGAWDDLPAAHGAAIAFDLLTLLGLFLLGRRLRGAAPLGVALAYAWAAYPYSAFALESNSNDTLVAAAVVVGAARRSPPARRRGGAAGARARVGAAAKFAPLALVPLFAAAAPANAARQAPAFAAGSRRPCGCSSCPSCPTVGCASSMTAPSATRRARPSPFSIWGQEESLGWLQATVKAAPWLWRWLVAFVPARARRPAQVAALGAAVLIALQLAMTHWFYLYVVGSPRSCWCAAGAAARPGPAAGDQAAPARRTSRCVEAPGAAALALLGIAWAAILLVDPWADQRITTSGCTARSPTSSSTANCPTATWPSSTRCWRRR